MMQGKQDKNVPNDNSCVEEIDNPDPPPYAQRDNHGNQPTDQNAARPAEKDC
jgi:hypothetical protein